MNDPTQIPKRSDDTPMPSALPASADPAVPSESSLVADRRAKLQRLRDEFGIDPYGQRVSGLVSLSDARGRYDAGADKAVKEDPGDDRRPVLRVAGRVVLHRNIGRLVFMTIRDETGDLQLGVSKKAVSETSFKLAKLADLGDLVVASGPIGTTKTQEVTIWATAPASGTGTGTGCESAEDAGAVETERAFTIVTKSLAPPPEKWHGLQDSEIRYRKRYVDLYVNPDVLGVFQTRSRVISHIRRFLAQPPGGLGGAEGAGFVEVETPMMQPQAGGAAARPFQTHHNALGMDLYLRVAPELYLKRLLVGGMTRVFEINRNFRNEGIDHSHNPEFTMLELYQAYGDYRSMMALTEQLIHGVAGEVVGRTTLAFKDHTIDFGLPFRRVTYHELFAEHNGFDGGDKQKLAGKAEQLGIDHAGKEHDVLLNEVWEKTVEGRLIQPTFVIDYPASLCPLTKTKRDNPEIAERFELFVAGMELANAYTELNDPDVQVANFERQLVGADDDEDTFRRMDHDFINALMVGMPPAGGLGIGIDRLVMLMTNSRSIRDVILFPLMRPQGGGATADRSD